MNIEAVLFDLDGVLIFSKEVWFHLLNAAALHFQAPEISRKTMEAFWGQGIQADKDNIFPGRSLAEIESYYNAHFMDHIEHVQVEPQAREVIEALHQAGRKTAVVTNTPSGAARDILARWMLEPQQVVGGTDVEHPKPAPDMLLLAMERLGVKPGAALMVGDTRYDREAAQAAGVRFAGYGIEGDLTLSSLADLLPPLGLKGGVWTV